MLIDSHAHMHFRKDPSEIPQVLAQAKAAGVGCIIEVGTDIDSSRKAIALAEKYPHIFAAVGIHPHEVVKATEANLAELKQLAQHERVMAIGEIGLDYYYEHS